MRFCTKTLVFFGKIEGLYWLYRIPTGISEYTPQIIFFPLVYELVFNAF